MKNKLILYSATALATACAVWLIFRSLSRYSLAEIGASLVEIPIRDLGTAGMFAACSYLCLTFFDYFALKYSGRSLPWRKAAIASFTSLAIGHNVGIAALSSGAIRYRFYSRWGCSNEDVAKVVMFCGVTVGLGLGTLAGLCLLIGPESAVRALPVAVMTARLVGGAILGVVAAYIIFAFSTRSVLTIKTWNFAMPEPKIAVIQVIIGAANFAFVAACLHALLGATSNSYYETVSAYVVGNIAAIVSHVPGGAGVLEATIRLVSGGVASIAALIMFRIVYFFIPLVGGIAILVLSELFIDAKKMPPPE